MPENGVADELSTDLGHDHERVGFAFADAELADVVLDIGLVAIGMSGIVELLAARCLQIVDPGQVIGIDEIGVEAKSDND
jgi:hypothetical protein